MKRINGLVPWWYWMWLVHGVFVTLMYFYYFSKKPQWVKASWSSVSLAHEMNYAVWWAGICLFLAALIFYRIASHHRDNAREATIWLILSLMALALSIDELGSLHELVGAWYGWLGLLPFALVLTISFGYAILQLLRRKGLRLTAILVLLAIFLFAAVAGLEYVEHNLRFESKALQRFRLVAEEGIELVGVSLLIIGGLIAMSHYGLKEKSIRVLAGRSGDLRAFRELAFVSLVAHMLMMITLIIPNSYLLQVMNSGNPAALFPIYLLFMTATTCFYIGSSAPNARFLHVAGVLLLLASLGQTYNYNRLFNNLFTLDTDWFTGEPGSWLVTLIPLLVLSAWTWTRSAHCRMKIILNIVIVLAVAGLAYPDRFQPMNYYMFSGAMAYACYWLIQIWLQSGDAPVSPVAGTVADHSLPGSSSRPS